MLLALGAIVLGLIVLVWSADKFVEGAASTAGHFNVSPLLIGMIIVGFGTSAPEMVVSALSALNGNPGIALGNAYGSNITNIAFILGLTALLSPIAVQSGILRKELPVLLAVTALAAFQLSDLHLSRLDAAVLISVLAGLLLWTFIRSRSGEADHLGDEVTQELIEHPMPIKTAVTWVIVGLILLVGSSQVLVWGAVTIATLLGVSDLIIGLTIVAVGTSLPELASSIAAVRKNEHDIALGNVIGSNLFNTLAVVGIAGSLHPMDVPPEALSRDMVVMGALTLALFLVCFGFRRPGRINRFEGGALLAVYVAYTGWLIYSAFA